MGEDVVVRGLFTLRDFNSTESNLKAKDHLFCITYFDDHSEHEIMLIWRRGKSVFSRTLNHGLSLPKDTKSVVQFHSLIKAAQDILYGKQVNLLEI